MSRRPASLHDADAAPPVPEPAVTSPSPHLVTTVARGLLAAAVLLSAVVHLELWAGGMSAVDVVGPAFLANAIGGALIAIGVLVWRGWLPPAAALAFGAAPLGAFVVSTTDAGLFGVHETWSGVPQMLSAVAEAVAVVLAVAVLVGESRRATE